jgi:ketosteroid isomerase-like protein
MRSCPAAIKLAIALGAPPAALGKASDLRIRSPDMTDQEQRNLEAARTLYEITGRADWDAAAEQLTDDFVAVEAPGLPYAGVYRGRNALKELYGKVMAMMDVTGLDIHQMAAGGDWVIVLVDIVTRDADGSELRLPLAEAMRFRDGKVCEITPYYFDPALAARAVDAKQRQVA